MLADPSNLNKNQLVLILSNGGQLHVNMGDYEAAAVLLDSAMAISTQYLGTGQSAYAYTTTLRTRTAIVQGDFELAANLSRSLAKEQQKQLMRASGHLSAAELELYAVKLSYGEALVNAVIYASGNATLPADAYDDALFFKGLSLQTAAAQRALHQGDTLVQRLEASRKQYCQMLARQYALPIPDRKAGHIQELEEQVNALEKALSTRVTAYAPARQPVTRQQVQRALRKGDAAIEIVRFPAYYKQGPILYQYAALVLLHQMEGVLFIPLCDERRLAALLTESGTDIQTAGNLYASRSGELLDKRPAYGDALYKLLWDPLDSLLQERGVKQVYLSPTGLLHQIAFRALPLPGKNRVLADRYAIRQLSSTRVLAEGRDGRTGVPARAVVFGGVDYEHSSGFGQAIGYYTEMPGNPPLQRHVVAYGPDQQFSYLPGTLQEARNLEHILAAKGVQVRLFTGEQAGEEQLKAVCAQSENRPQLLHIATNGFHFEVDSTLYGGEAGLDNPFAQQTHPLMRSGLALAGANRVWSGEAISEDREDGIATAFEISQLDLTGTQLAVLSACGTGRGDIKGAEGVYGLQRGFKLAGARYLMLSLWAVPDRETAVFMQYFYRQWAKGNTLSDAFDQAQKKMRKRFKEPEYWAAWMLLE